MYTLQTAFYAKGQLLSGTQASVTNEEIQQISSDTITFIRKFVEPAFTHFRSVVDPETVKDGMEFSMGDLSGGETNFSVHVRVEANEVEIILDPSRAKDLIRRYLASGLKHILSRLEKRCLMLEAA